MFFFISFTFGKGEGRCGIGGVCGPSGGVGGGGFQGGVGGGADVVDAEGEEAAGGQDVVQYAPCHLLLRLLPFSQDQDSRFNIQDSRKSAQGVGLIFSSECEIVGGGFKISIHLLLRFFFFLSLLEKGEGRCGIGGVCGPSG